MDEQIGAFACAVSGAALFAAVGVVFGGVARFLARRHGNETGGPLGDVVLDALRRVSRRELPPATGAVLSGAVEGAAFLGVLGAAVGLVAARGTQPFQVMLMASAGLGMLAVGAVLFGLVAYGLVWVGVRVVASVFVCGMVGALLGGRMGGTDGILLGAVAGALAGTLFGVLTAPPDSEQEPPHSPE